jgi:ubiquinone/menaquinone biosynthesis C-methylase UbiE
MRNQRRVISSICTKEVFNIIGERYRTCDRLSENCARQISKKVKEQIQKYKKPLILDVGIGMGYFDSIFLSELKELKIILLDVSFKMLNGAAKSINDKEMIKRCSFINADVTAIPLNEHCIDAVLMFIMMHLIEDKNLAFAEISRVMKDGRPCFILTYDPIDMGSQIYHECFPGYAEIDRSRHLPIEHISELLRYNHFTIQTKEKFSYSITYDNAETLTEFITTKPFSAFFYYSEEEFKSSLSIFHKRLKKKFGNKPVINASTLTLIMSTKNT